MEKRIELAILTKNHIKFRSNFNYIMCTWQTPHKFMPEIATYRPSHIWQFLILISGTVYQAEYSSGQESFLDSI
jgi:hypothetical protein